MSIRVRVCALGYRGVGGQIDRIEEGFRALGCEVVSSIYDAGLIYCNDSGFYQPVIDAKSRAKVIFNCLDLAPHILDFPLALIKEQLSHADAVTTISSTVQRDIRARLGVEAKVVYNPIRGVAYARPLPPEVKHPFRAMFVGRVQDEQKRAALGASALAILGFGYDEVVTVGRELPHYGGVYWGETSDEALSDLYNSVDFLMCPTRNAFLGLPILEAMACGTIPVVCNDLDVRQEFLPSSVFPEYDSVGPSAPEIARFVARFMQDNDAKAEFSQRVHNHYVREWTTHLSPAGVAAAILRVYEAL